MTRVTRRTPTCTTWRIGHTCTLSFVYFLLYLFYFPFLVTDGDSMTINNLRDSANGTFVTLDDHLSLT